MIDTSFGEFSQTTHIIGAKIQMDISIRYKVGANGPECGWCSFSFDKTPEEYRGKIRTFTTKPYEAAAILNQIINKSFKDVGYKHYKSKDIKELFSDDWKRIIEKWEAEASKEKFGQFQVELKKLLEKYGYEMNAESEYYDGDNANIVIFDTKTGNEFYI